MWHKGTGPHDWHMCWQDETGYWFFHQLAMGGYFFPIGWLHAYEREDYNLFPKGGNYDRGEWHYYSHEERDETWNRIIENPVSFIVRAALHVDTES